MRSLSRAKIVQVKLKLWNHVWLSFSYRKFNKVVLLSSYQQVWHKYFFSKSNLNFVNILSLFFFFNTAFSKLLICSWTVNLISYHLYYVILLTFFIWFVQFIFMEEDRSLFEEIVKILFLLMLIKNAINKKRKVLITTPLLQLLSLLTDYFFFFSFDISLI